MNRSLPPKEALPDRDALLQKAQGLRAQGHLSDALSVLDRLQRQYPRFSRLHQERGHCLALLGQAQAAIAALSEAVRLNPTLPGSWDMLAQLFRQAGDAPQAAQAARHLDSLRQLPPEIVVANCLFADGDFDPAEAVLRDYVRKDSDNAGALRLLARLCAQDDRLEDAETLLGRVLLLAPDYHEARLDYGRVLLDRQKPQAARDEAARLLAHDRDHREALKLYGAASIALGDHETVIDLYERLLAGPLSSSAEAADLRLWRANALKVTGRQAEAIADYRASLMARPDNGVVWFSLANLKTYRFSDEELTRLRTLAARPDLQPMDRVYLSFAMGKALEDRADYAASWPYYQRGNALRRSLGHWRADVADACAQRLKAHFTADVFAARSGWGCDEAAPVFIVGLPRSGSTLIEQILASHPQVEGTQELPEIGRYAAELCGRDPANGLPSDPQAILNLSPAQVRALGERYLSETRVYRRMGRPLFIDKMPNNFWHIGLIHLILPQATIIDVRRDPMSCGFSNLKQLFGTSHQEFTYDAGDMAHYYRTYLDLMRHWEAVLPGRVLRVAYEDVIDDLEANVRRLLGHARLPFDAACLRFYETQRSIRTPSSEQVRQPLSRDGLTQWQNYAPWLGALKDGLGDALTRYRE